MAEGGTIGAPAAIAKAIADALATLGVEISSTPLTPVRISGLVAERESATPQDGSQGRSTP
jgi:carbon-monoxide dehydrogenase large subunit